MTPNKALHRTAISLLSVAAGELNRYAALRAARRWRRFYVTA